MRHATTPGSTAPSREPLGGFRGLLRALYYGRSGPGRVFQWALLILDLVVLAYFVATTFVRDATWLVSVDLGGAEELLAAE